MPTSAAHAILDAVHFASRHDVRSLRQLVLRAPETLSTELVLRILLTYLPEATEPASYV